MNRPRLLPRRIYATGSFVAVVFVVLALLPPAAAGAQTLFTPNGQLDFTYGALVDVDGGPSTGQKPESKLFYTQEGSPTVVRWWAVLGTAGPSPAAGLYLWELVNHAWVPRFKLPGADPWAKADTVLDGTRLYVSARDNVSDAPGNPRSSNLFELDYLGGGGWGNVAGPFEITTANPEALTIAKDSQGRIWTAYEGGRKIHVGYTAPGGTTFTFTNLLSTDVDGDDIAVVTAFGGNRIGVFWSDQNAKRDFFAWRWDSDPVAANWTIETAFGGGVGNCPTANSSRCADDHMNVAVVGDEIYVAVKTSLEDDPGAPNDPTIVLLHRTANGAWSAYPVSPVSQSATRGITLVSPDQDRIWVWATRDNESEIDVWESSLSSLGFNSSQYTVWIKAGHRPNNATSTKQVVTSATGAVVEATVDTDYQVWHNEFLPTGPPPPAPAISGFSPTSGPQGTAVTIDGSGFTGASDVRFGSTSASAFTVVSDTRITTSVPAGASTGPISVVAPGGTVTSSTNFTVPPPPMPTISGFSPTSGPQGTAVTIDGSGFTGASDVRFGSTSASAFTVVSDTRITTSVPAGASTGPISVVAPGGTVTSSTNFTVPPPPTPTISGFSPTSGPQGTAVTIDGSGFTGASDVRFGSTSASAFTVVSDTRITTSVPAGASTGPISVVAPGGTATSAGTFAVTSTITFVATDDAEIDSSLPGTNFGSATSFSVDHKPVKDGLLRFAVTVGANQQIASVKLRLYCVNRSPVGGFFYGTGASWNQATVTWNNAPAAGAQVGSLGSVSVGTWYEVDVTSLVTSSGAYALRINSNSSNGADYSTVEGPAAQAPRLVVTLV